MTAARILLVEDEPHLALGLQENLEDEGYEVEHRADGASGLEAMTQGGFDLAVLDVMLPKLDGFALCEQARADGVVTPVLFLTAKGGVPPDQNEQGQDDAFGGVKVPFEWRQTSMLAVTFSTIAGATRIGDDKPFNMSDLTTLVTRTLTSRHGSEARI